MWTVAQEHPSWRTQAGFPRWDSSVTLRRAQQFECMTGTRLRARFCGFDGIFRYHQSRPSHTDMCQSLDRRFPRSGYPALVNSVYAGTVHDGSTLCWRKCPSTWPTSPKQPSFSMKATSKCQWTLSLFIITWWSTRHTRLSSFSYRHIAISSIKPSFMVRRFITMVENEDNWVYFLDKNRKMSDSFKNRKMSKFSKTGKHQNLNMSESLKTEKH